MELREGYKRTDIGVIPKDWEQVLVGNMLTICHGRNQKHVEDPNGEYPILATGGQIGTSREFLYDRPSVLIGRKGTIDKPQFMSTPFWTVDTLFYSRIASHADAKYLYYQFQLIDWKRFNEASGVPSLNAGTIESILIVKPSLAEQHAIAEVLSDTDELIESLEQLIEKKRNIKQGAMQELLTGKRRLPGFEGEWEQFTFQDVFLRINAKNYQIYASDYQSVGAFPIVDQGQNYVVGYTDRADRVYDASSEGIIVFGDHTCIVKHVEGKFVVGADGTQLISTHNRHNCRFHYYQLQAQPIQPTGYNRHFKYLLERKSYGPSNLEEQQAIAVVLTDMDDEIEALEARLAKTRQIKQGMMEQLLTGRIRLI